MSYTGTLEQIRADWNRPLAVRSRESGNPGVPLVAAKKATERPRVLAWIPAFAGTNGSHFCNDLRMQSGLIKPGPVSSTLPQRHLSR
jgi:hypothetical protein